MVQAVILAGGAGTRLRPVTDRLPKPMVPVNGRPFLAHLVDFLQDQGVDRVLMCTGYMHEVVEEYFSGGVSGEREGRRPDLTVEFSAEPGFLGTGGALLLARSRGLLEREFLLLNGDSHFPIDLRAFRDRFRREKEREPVASAMISVYSNTHPRICANNLVVNGDAGRILLYDKTRETKEMNGVEAGTSVFTHRIFELMPPLESLSVRAQCSLEMEVYPELIANGELAAYVTDTRFHDMGTPEGLKEMEEALGV